MPNRFDYVAYDKIAAEKQADFKAKVQELEGLLDEHFPSSPGGQDPHGRAKALSLTTLEEFYMWVGKATRDDQVARNGSAPLQEARDQG